MELWNLVVSFFANIPLYYQNNRTLFLVTLGIVLVYAVINAASYYQVIVRIKNPLLKVGWALVATIGVLALVTSGVAFVSAQEIAELRPEVLTRPLFLQLAVVAAIDAGIWLAAIYRRGKEMEDEEAQDAFKALLKATFVALYSLAGAFVGNRISSWGPVIFGQSIGTWIFGAYLLWAMNALFGVLGFAVQGPLVLLFGNPDAKVEDAVEGAVDNLFDEFLDKPRGQRDWRKVIIPAAIVLVLVVGLGFARNVFQEEATTPDSEQPTEVPAQPEEAPAENEAAPSSDVPGDHVMDWGDAALEAKMREVTGIAEGDIWLHDVQDLTVLDLSVTPDEDGVIREGPRITSIDALAELTNLTKLRLFFQDVERIDAVASMPHLQYLDLQYNEVNDLSPLAGHQELYTVTAGHCKIVDLAPLASCPNLRMLSLNNNSISDLDPLRNLTSLTYLDLEGNPVQTYEPVEGLGIEELKY